MLGGNDLFDKDGNQRMTASDLLVSVVELGKEILGRPDTTVFCGVFSRIRPALSRGSLKFDTESP